MAYCTEDQVKAAVNAHGDDGDRFSSAEISTAMDFATMLVERYTGRHFLNQARTETHRPVDNIVYLDHWPVVSVSECVDSEDGDDVSYDIVSAEWGKLRVYSSELVKITYTYNEDLGGGDYVPDEIKDITAEIACNYLLLPSDALEQLRLGDMNVLGGVAIRLLTPSIQAALDKYNHRKRVI